MTLVTILITTILTIFSSYYSYRENIIRNKGNWEAEFLCVKYSSALKIAKDKNVKEASIYYDYGMSAENLVDSKTSFSRIHLFGYDENKIKNSKLCLEEGRFPQNSSEIVISSNGASHLTKNIGNELEMTFEGNTKKYVIVGLVESIEGDTYNGYEYNGGIVDDGKDLRGGAVTLLENIADDDIVNVSVLMNDIRKIYNTTNSINQSLKLYEVPNTTKVTGINRNELETVDDGFYASFQNTLGEFGISGINTSNPEIYEEKVPTEKVKYNEELLEYLRIATNEDSSISMPFLLGNLYIYFTADTFNIILAITLLIISISGIALIFTSFTITYRERIKELEMLSSLGMSKSQIRIMCLKEGIIVATIRNSHRYHFRYNHVRDNNTYFTNIIK